MNNDISHQVVQHALDAMKSMYAQFSKMGYISAPVSMALSPMCNQSLHIYSVNTDEKASEQPLMLYAYQSTEPNVPVFIVASNNVKEHFFIMDTTSDIWNEGLTARPADFTLEKYEEWDER